MPDPLLFVVPVAILETVSFYWWHWPHRRLLPDRFRSLLLAKGALKGLAAIALTFMLSQLSHALGWGYAIGHLVLGITLHIRWCRQHGVDPLRVQPREQYVLATSAWIDRLEAAEKVREESRKAKERS